MRPNNDRDRWVDRCVGFRPEDPTYLFENWYAPKETMVIIAAQKL